MSSEKFKDFDNNSSINNYRYSEVNQENNSENQQENKSGNAQPPEPEPPTHTIEFKYDSTREDYYHDHKTGDEQDLEGNNLQNINFWVINGDNSHLFQNLDLTNISQPVIVND